MRETSIEQIKITEIKWGDRARKDYGDITKLAESIDKKGLIQPIVLSSDNQLIAGGRRLTAIISLKHETAPIIRKGNLSELEMRELELEENLFRKDLTWQENAFLVQEIHRLKQSQDNTWTGVQTAELIDKSRGFVSDNLKLAKGLEKYPELKDVKDFASAYTQLRRKMEQEQRAIVAEAAPSYEFLHNADALSILPQIKDNTIDLVLLDPPYGVNIQDKEARGTCRTGSWTWAGSTYDDSTENALILMDALLAETARILKPGAHCYLFFGLTLELTDGVIHKLIEKHLGYQKLPLFWVKNTHSNKDPYKRFGISYEPIYFCWKGAEPRDLIIASHAVLAYPVDAREKAHPSEKPDALYRRLISISTQENEIVLDPTAGSGASIAAAIGLGRRAIGIEMDENYFNLMKTKVMKGEKNGEGE